MKERFRWAVCQLDVLRKCISPTELRKALKSLPKTLYETYDRILLAIQEEHRRDALRMLQWLAFVVRPISLEEAVEVLATDPDAEDGPLFDPGRRPWDPRNVVTVCSSLVTIGVTEVKVHREAGGTNQNREASELRLAHFSVREYLTSEHLQKCNPKLSYYHFNQTVADMCIAKTCLAYLLQFNEHNCVSSNTSRAYPPLSRYAARKWMDHAQSDTHGESDSLHRLVMALFQPRDPMYKNWVRLYATYHLLDNPEENIPSPLYYSSSAGLERTCQDLLRAGWDVNAQKDKEYGTALQVAAYRGHEGVVRLLLDNGADVNVTSSWRAVSSVGPIVSEPDPWIGGNMHFSTALQAACARHERIVRLLLDKGADINARGEYINTALQVAAYEGVEELARLLLDHGADVNAQGGVYDTALQAASRNGHHSMVQLLLGVGANVNARGGKFETALQAAVWHQMVVQLLLANGAHVNAQGGIYGTALQAAVCNGHKMVVQLLLENGADANARGGCALWAASSSGHDGIVQLLLDKGADVNATKEDIGTALQVAASKGHEGVVRLLLENGADVNAQGGRDHGTALQAAPYTVGPALQAAAIAGHERLVRLLLDNGADINARGGAHDTALQAASQHGHEGIVRLLLDSGADVNCQGFPCRNALQAASYGGYEGIAQLLLENGAEVNPREGEIGSALQSAAMEGMYGMVRFLLEKGANVNALGGVDGTPLQSASYCGDVAIVQLLLEKGADMDAPGGQLGTALEAALSKGHSTIIELLQAHKAARITQLQPARTEHHAVIA
jgi:ankyrin repeat protein